MRRSLITSDAQAGAWSGHAALQGRIYTQSPADPRQHGDVASVSFQPEYYHSWNDNRDSFLVVPFVRWDQHDEERSHADLRELAWIHAAPSWELRAGVRKVFWGVTESQHLVDIINQTDLVEDPDGEDKLGQPMVNLAWVRDWGTLDLFVLPYFRERTFPGSAGRLRPPLAVDTDQARYESAREQRHIDAALRWSRYLGDWDIGLSHYSGTRREPRLVPGFDDQGAPVLVPHYDLIRQTGLDVQMTRGAWLWKLEAIYRKGQGERFFAATGGVEYTLIGIGDGNADVGLVAEYLYDERGAKATTPFQNDVMVGLRLALNDVQSSAALLGAIVDSDSGATFYSLEASRRLGHQWKVDLEARAFVDVPVSDPLYGLHRDDYLQVELGYYF